MYYLELGLMPMVIALGAGCVASALAAWATRSSKDDPPVLLTAVSTILCISRNHLLWYLLFLHARQYRTSLA
jgi:hypothetical protein